jgi:hypothetical protein
MATMRIISGCLVAACLLTVPVMAETSVRRETLIGAPFNQELFELAHSVFLANSNLPDALAVSERAIEAHPDNRTWRTKGGQTAEWAGRPELALRHWSYLAAAGDETAVRNALRISRTLNELPLRKQLLKNLIPKSSNVEFQKEYLSVTEALGLPEEAYATLSSGRLPMLDPVWQLTEQARLADVLGLSKESFALWHTRAALKPLSSDEALQLASLWYGQGNAVQALRVMQKVAPTTAEDATVFWRTYTDLAWTLQNIPEAIRGAELAIRTGTAVEADYQRIQLTYQEADPVRVYPIACAAWVRFPKPVWWYVMVDTGLRSGHAKELAHFFATLPEETKGALTRDARSWYYLGLVLRHNGDRAGSLKAVRTAVQHDKSSADLLADYLWMLIDFKQTEELRSLILTQETRFSATPELREPLAAALVQLGEPTRALPYYRVLARSRQDDPLWLTSYADVLEQSGYPESAWQARRYARSLLSERLRSGSEPPESVRRNLVTRAQLELQLSPGENLARLMTHIATGKNDDAGRELVMGWIMATGQSDLARFWYWRGFARTAERSEWIQLGAALEEHDRTGIADIIETSLPRLPYRDAIEGARQAGMTPLAESLAFDRLQTNPTDHLLDKQIRELYSHHPAALRQRLILQEQGGVGFLEEVISFSYPITARLSLMSEASNTGIHHQKSGVLGTYVHSIKRGVVGLQMQHERGTATLVVGTTDALYQYNSYGISSDVRLNSRMQLDLVAQFGWQATENVPLRIGGLKDEISVGLMTTLTPRDSFSTRLMFQYLRDQERRSLGRGYSLEGEATHRLLFERPDINLRIFSGYHQFEKDGTPTGRTLSLIPASVADGSDFFIPRSFATVGGGVRIGRFYGSEQSREWLPFGAADLSWNSVGGFGYHYEAGLAGPVFGLDLLELLISQESGRFGSADTNSAVEIRYRYSLN